LACRTRFELYRPHRIGPALRACFLMNEIANAQKVTKCALKLSYDLPRNAR
jgi:hypothetical protein